MSRIVALDTETTGLDPACEQVFEVATIDLDTGHENVWHFEPWAEVVSAMHPKAVEVNRYHDRTGAPDWVWHDEEFALGHLYFQLAGAHLLGAVPDFDARHLTALYRRFGHEPPRWHYHLIDVETLAVGYLLGSSAGHTDAGMPPLPWKSDDLSRAVGVEPPSGDDRHTALADARWVRDLYLHITGGAA